MHKNKIHERKIKVKSDFLFYFDLFNSLIRVGNNSRDVEMSLAVVLSLNPENL